MKKHTKIIIAIVALSAAMVVGHFWGREVFGIVVACAAIYAMWFILLAPFILLQERAKRKREAKRRTYSSVHEYLEEGLKEIQSRRS